MISDFVGGTGTNELSVSKGQQVEVLEMSATTPDYCLVRVAATGGVSNNVGAGSSAKSSVSGGGGAFGGNSQPQQEGLVPMSILKPPPAFSKTSPRRTLDLENSGECDESYYIDGDTKGLSIEYLSNGGNGC